jgi:hypothetical protein
MTKDTHTLADTRRHAWLHIMALLLLALFALFCVALIALALGG